MRALFSKLVLLFFAAALTACGGGSDPAGPVTLSAGQSRTLAKGDIVKVPSGTQVKSASGTSMTVNGNANTVNTSAGAVVTVPASATGAADNTIVAN